MFGFITPTKSKLEKKDIEDYRAYYCGLCHSLKQTYGKTGMAVLSYDFVFLSMLLSDLYNTPMEEGSERCVSKPVMEHRYTLGKYTEYSADMQMLVTYWAVADHVRDEGKEKKKLEKLSAFMPALVKKYPRQAECLENGLRDLTAREKQGETNAEKMASIFGGALAEVFSPEDDFFRPALLAMGSALGRFCYLMDAMTDRKDDEKKKQYNPLLSRTDEEIEKMLVAAASDAADAFEKLPLDDNLAVLRNIIYSGIWKAYDKETKK